MTSIFQKFKSGFCSCRFWTLSSQSEDEVFRHFWQPSSRLRPQLFCQPTHSFLAMMGFLLLLLLFFFRLRFSEFPYWWPRDHIELWLPVLLRTYFLFTVCDAFFFSFNSMWLYYIWCPGLMWHVSQTFILYYLFFLCNDAFFSHSG